MKREDMKRRSLERYAKLLQTVYDLLDYYPTAASLAERLECSTNKVYDAIHELECLHLVKTSQLMLRESNGEKSPTNNGREMHIKPGGYIIVKTEREDVLSAIISPISKIYTSREELILKLNPKIKSSV